MTPEIKQRIEQIRRGEVPEGYVKTRAGIMPLDWEVSVPAKAVFKNHSDKKHNGQFEVLSATQDRGIIPRSEVDINIKYDESGIDSYKKVEKGDFVISLRSFQGGIEHSEYDGLVSPAYTVLKAKRPIDPGYYRAYFKTADFINRLNSAVYGIRDGKQIGYEDFGDLILHFPPLQEQRKIAEILTTCDRVIELKQKLVDELKQLKKICLTKMFPREGSDVPEQRFPGFTAPWEQRKLGDILQTLPFKSYLKSPEQDGKYEIIQQGNDPIIGYANGEPCKDYEDTVIFGDHTLSLFKPKNPFFVATDGVRIVKGFDKMDGKYLLPLLERNKPQSEGYKRYYSILADVDVFFTENHEEQSRIGEYFSELDDLITLHQRKLEQESQKKKALMQLLLTGIVRVL